MKRIWIGFFLFFGLICYIYSTALTDFYYHDYDLITRAVMVFDEKPEYKIEQEDDKIITYIFDAKLKANLPDSLIHHSPVFKEITSKSNGGVLQVIFHTHKKMMFMNFGFYHDGYKLVYDIYSIEKPTAAAEHRSFADFYTIVGFQNKAERHLKLAETLAEHEEIEKADWFAQFIQTNVEFKTYIIPLWLLIVICSGLIIVLMILLLLIRKVKKRRKWFKRSQHAYIQSGFGSKDLQKRIIKRLSENDWDISAIAQELFLSEEKVRKYLSETGE